MVAYYLFHERSKYLLQYMSLMAELGEGPPPQKKNAPGPHEGQRGFGPGPGGPMGGGPRPPFNQPPHLMNDIIRAGLELERSTPRVSQAACNRKMKHSVVAVLVGILDSGSYWI